MTDMPVPPFFLTLFERLPRQGPGSTATTLRALDSLRPLPHQPRILDIGAGSGTQSLDLARSIDCTVIATDLHEPFLDTLKERAVAQGLSGRISTQVADMKELPFQEGEFDMIWAEGSIFLAGFAAGLRAWRPLLKGRGAVVVSEATWLVDHPPLECKRWWDEEYPAITTIEENLRMVADCGYDLIDHFVLPPSGWRDSYYEPLRRQLELARESPSTTPAELEVVSMLQTEIDLYDRFGDTYGYVFFVMRRTD